MNTDLSGKRALVCGASQGIGRASAAALAELGASVTLLARDEAALGRVAESLSRKGAGQTHAVMVADFTDTAAVERAVKSRTDAGEVFNILVNNTGGPKGGPLTNAEPKEILDAMTMHVASGQVLVRALVPGMKTSGYGRIINIISTSVKAPIPGLGVSNTVRAAVANWAKTLSGELAPSGITVNNVLPGFTDTERLRSLIAARAKAGNVPEAQVSEDMCRSVPMGRFGTAEEIAAAVAFLASPAAAYISGINLPVDGGRTPSL